ncbi:predicted protein [Lodderomyces elongisporus NRRL YB-4239]|uniref:Uncharacterized protein n=1 Tax=Lodderomyces elongisporus (strain ATCC 11503 / CBS 2605 / JCM 1781 / NBRC 1676 / NRRL YB-4239) TaxID=379508 RepID=A5DT95_LODEL|nr:predicted protein [Lodderomyces elongisporus NRRL YB-4239]
MGIEYATYIYISFIVLCILFYHSLTCTLHYTTHIYMYTKKTYPYTQRQILFYFFFYFFYLFFPVFINFCFDCPVNFFFFFCFFGSSHVTIHHITFIKGLQVLLLIPQCAETFISLFFFFLFFLVFFSFLLIRLCFYVTKSYSTSSLSIYLSIDLPILFVRI